MSKVIGWWSGGVTSAVACKITLDIYGHDNVRLIFIDTGNEDDDTYRFKSACEIAWTKEIEVISGIGDKYESIQDVWKTHKSLNVSHGAVCSYMLKRKVREKWEKDNEWLHQVFGFDLDEVKRAKGLLMNHSHTKPIFPLMMYGYDKKKCIEIVESWGIDIPRMYQLGFLNNNCFKTGCVQGGIGYWQKIMREYPEKFDAMSKVEHELTDLKGEPVTMLKDQSNEAKQSGNKLVFLNPHPSYPNIKDLSMMKGREPKPLFECNGFCGTNDLEERSTTEEEINYDKRQQKLF